MSPPSSPPACSESQITSYIDFSTNFCNIRQLLCGSKEGCKTMNHDFAPLSPKYDDCWQHDSGKCITVPAAAEKLSLRQEEQGPEVVM